MKAYAFVADGMEEVECLMVVDLLRRAGIDMKTVSIMGRNRVVSSHKIALETDLCFEEVDFSDAELLFLPGGMPGTNHLADHAGLAEVLKGAATGQTRIAAICAAPSVLGRLHLLEGKKAVCYPGFEEYLYGATVLEDKFVTDGNITTSRGLGTALDLGLELIRIAQGEEAAQAMKVKIVANL